MPSSRTTPCARSRRSRSPWSACRPIPARRSRRNFQAACARALALDPELLFLDEPTAGLDPIGAAHYDELVKGLCHSLGLTVLMVTHDLDSLNAICDRIAVLLDKRVVVGTMAELLVYDHPWVREYFHGPRGRAARQE
jgi:phospholipid/cholesterol/gamma-HCH transport system ATP-binding protein